MDTWKRVALFTVATGSAIYLAVWCLDAFGFRSPTFAFLVNWLAMFWVVFADQAAHFAFPQRYYDIRAFERTGLVYERLGIRLFKALVRRGPLTILSPTLRFPKERTIPGLRNLDNEMRKAETGHMIIFILMLLLAGYALLRRWFDAAGWLLVFNLIINGYPIMLQRYNRIKLGQLILAQSADQT
jgi:hypothetical protein